MPVIHFSIKRIFTNDSNNFENTLIGYQIGQNLKKHAKNEDYIIIVPFECVNLAKTSENWLISNP